MWLVGFWNKLLCDGARYSPIDKCYIYKDIIYKTKVNIHNESILLSTNLSPVILY